MSETIKSKFLWSEISAIIAAVITDVYNLVKASISYQSISTIVPIILAIAGISLLDMIFGEVEESAEIYLMKSEDSKMEMMII